MKIRLTDLDPHFVKRVSPVDYEHTDDIREADGLQMRCPACYWVEQRVGAGLGHATMIWHDPAHWDFVGRDYRDLSLMQGHALVTMSGGCTRFLIKDGKVDFD